MNNKDIAIISVVYNNYSVLGDFFKSFCEQTNNNYHLFISDLSDNKKLINNNSLPLKVIPAKNFGYAYGVNLAIKEARRLGYDRYCIVNSDTYVNQQFTTNLDSSIKNHPSSIIGGKIYYAPGFEYHKNKYNKNEAGKVIWYAGGKIDWNNVYIKHSGVDEIDKGQYDKFGQTDFITGCLMAFDKEVVDTVGYWDEKYFLYYEDADYCQRAINKGVKLFYNPSLTIWHKNAQSTGGSGSNIHIKHQNKNRVIFGLKYAPLKTKIHLIKNLLMA